MADLDSKATEPLFRASKRRKIFRKAQEDESNDIASSRPQLSPPPIATPESHPPLPQNDISPEEQHNQGLSVAEILRRRKLGKARRAGIEFSNSAQASPRSSVAIPSDALVPTIDESRSAVDVASKRFAPQTGKVTDVHDKHMMEFIDSKMAELRHSQAAFSNSTTSLDNLSTEDRATAIAASEKARERQPAGVGKLQEIDLGPDATAQNIARTEAARRRLEGRPEKDEPQSGLRSGKVRLGRDGKPWRGRKRRNSEDVKRDLLVEEVLRESRLDMYDEPEAPGGSDGDQAADDLLAERFRQEFLDAVDSRNIRRAAPAPPGAAKGEERPKGPKLGGSRSARAAMRALEEKAAKKR